MQAFEARRLLALALLWVTPALWAVNFIIARSARGVVEPHMLALGRWALAGAILVLIVRAELWRERRSVLAVWRQCMVLGALGMLVCGAWVYLGAKTTQAMNIALIYAAAPALISLGSALWLKERLSRVQLLGVGVAMAGVVHVVVKGQWAALAQVHWVVGDGWIVLATISWALYALLQKMWPSALSTTARLASICIGCVLVLLPFADRRLNRNVTATRLRVHNCAKRVGGCIAPAEFDVGRGESHWWMESGLPGLQCQIQRQGGTA